MFLTRWEVVSSELRRLLKMDRLIKIRRRSSFTLTTEGLWGSAGLHEPGSYWSELQIQIFTVKSRAMLLMGLLGDVLKTCKPALSSSRRPLSLWNACFHVADYSVACLAGLWGLLLTPFSHFLPDNEQHMANVSPPPPSFSVSMQLRWLARFSCLSVFLVATFRFFLLLYK